MVVEDADRFGLSQHQLLRPYVGRGTRQSYSASFFGADKGLDRPRTAENPLQDERRLEIARGDLQRGPGDFFGRRQHGLPRPMWRTSPPTSRSQSAREESRGNPAADPTLSGYRS